MKDHKGYMRRPLDWQDRVVLVICAVAVGFLFWLFEVSP